MSPSSSKWLAAIALVVTFLVGVVIGGIGSRVMLMRHGPHVPSAEFVVKRLDARLHLTDAQRTAVTAIVQRHEDKIRSIWTGVRPAVRTEIEAANAEIDRVLTPEQRATFAKIKLHLRR